MGTWGTKCWDSDSATDWFYLAFEGCDIDTHVENALKYYDNYAEIRAAAYLLTVLGRSSYVWPGDLDRLGDFVTRAASYLQDMLDPENDAGRELRQLWGSGEHEVFDEIGRELADLKAAHSKLF